jgi:hypothetical protein
MISKPLLSIDFLRAEPSTAMLTIPPLERMQNQAVHFSDYPKILLAM